MLDVVAMRLPAFWATGVGACTVHPARRRSREYLSVQSYSVAHRVVRSICAVSNDTQERTDATVLGWRSLHSRAGL